MLGAFVILSFCFNALADSDHHGIAVEFNSDCLKPVRSDTHAPQGTLRVIPTKMTMVGTMYAPTDWLTLMVMTMHMDKSMDHTTYMGGGTGTTVLGTFNTKSSGFGDTKISAMFNTGTHKMHINAGISLPTGDTDEEDDVLTPMGGTPTLRLPYAMQSGSGTYDLLPGLTYIGTANNFNWGAQYKDLNDPQLEIDLIVTAAWQAAF